MLTLKSVRLVNYKGFENTVLQFPHSGLTLVEGDNRDSDAASSNGAGKTDLCVESLCWALFGQGTKEKGPDGATVSGFRKDDVIRYGEKSCMVEVSLSKGNENWLIRRSRTKGSKESLELNLIGDDGSIKGKSIDDTQAIVETFLGMSYDTFLNTTFFGQGVKRFSQGKDSERKQVLEEMLELGVYSKALDKVRSLLTAVDGEIRSCSTGIDKAAYSLSVSERSLATAKQNYLNASQEFTQWKKISEEASDKVKSQLEAEQRLLQENTRKKEALEVRLNTIDVNALKTKQTALQERISELKSDIRQLEASIKEVKSDQDNMESLGGECYTCGQDIEEDYKQDYLKALSGKASKLESKRVSLDSELKKLIKKMSELEPSLTEAAKLASDIARLNWDIGHNKSTISKIKVVKSSTPQPPKPSRKLILEAEEEIKRWKGKISESEDQLKALQVKKENLDFWKVGFSNSGIKSLLMDDVLPILNQKANEYASILGGGAFSLEFDTESTLASGEVRDKFDLRVTLPSGVGYHRASGGERRRIDFCVALALQALQTSCSGRTNLFIMDEPFESVDQVGCEGLINLLREFAVANQVSILVITHLPDLKTYFDRFLLVRKESGISKLVSS